MSCCSGKKTVGIEPQATTNKSESSNEKIKPKVPVKSPDPTIEYVITVKTGNNRNSSTNGPVYVKIFGRDNKQTDDILLNNSSNEKSFQQDSIRKFQIKAIDIGKPQRIILRHEDKISGWFIDYVEILVHDFRIRFVANRWLDETKHDRKLSVELFGSEQPATSYNIEVRTGSEQNVPLDSPVYIQIYGTTTNTPKLFLESKNTPFATGSKAKFNISSNNVGEIRKIVIGHEELGLVNDWYLQHVKIQTDAQQYEFSANKWLSPIKGDKQSFVELTPEALPIASMMYLVKVQTGDVQQEKTIDNIEMSIRGSNGQIQKILLNDYAKSDRQQQLCQKGSLDQFEIKHEDIGEIESLTIGVNGNAAWLLETVDIIAKETVYHFRAECWLSKRLGSNFNWITIKPDANNNDITYKVIVRTGQSGVDANVMLCIHGDKDTTKILPLRTTEDGTQAKFDQDSQVEFDLKTVDVGKIEKINIGHDGKGNEQEWYLKSVEIEKNNEHFTFKADRELSEKQGSFVDLVPEDTSSKNDHVTYTITVVTSSEEDAGTDSGVFMTIYGDKDQTKQFQLLKSDQDSKTLFEQGQANEFQFEVNDVGMINKINIGQDSKGFRPTWHLKSVEIRKGTEIYKFKANQVLDLSTAYIDLKPRASSSDTSRSTSPEIKEKLKETAYKVAVRFGKLQQGATDDTNLHIVIIGNDGKTKKIPLQLNGKGESEFTTIDVGQISKILLGQDETEHGSTCHVDKIIIENGNEETTFIATRSIEPNTVIELTPSTNQNPSDKHSTDKQTETDNSISLEPSTSDVKRKDTNYKIKISTGGKAFDGPVEIKIRGEYGIICIPLSTTKNGEKPFQVRSVDEFTSRTTDVGKIKRIIIETGATEKQNVWDLKKIQIIKGNEVYNFPGNVRLDSKKSKVTLQPLGQKKEDYIEGELRRLQENLRTESSKMRRPKQKAYEPYVYNDLSPYFDTSTVERAINEPLETPSGYYSRVTALRVVEPWEAYGMDYGVNYELLKQRRNRGHSAKRTSTSQHGMMLLPPLSLPYGGQITYVNSTTASPSRPSSAAPKRRSSSKTHNEHIQTTIATA